MGRHGQQPDLPRRVAAHRVAGAAAIRSSRRPRPAVQPAGPAALQRRRAGQLHHPGRGDAHGAVGDPAAAGAGNAADRSVPPSASRPRRTIRRSAGRTLRSRPRPPSQARSRRTPRPAFRLARRRLRQPLVADRRRSSATMLATMDPDTAALRLAPRIAPQPATISLGPGESRVWNVDRHGPRRPDRAELVFRFDPRAMDVTDVSVGSALAVDPTLPPIVTVDRDAGHDHASSSATASRCASPAAARCWPSACTAASRAKRSWSWRIPTCTPPAARASSPPWPAGGRGSSSHDAIGIRSQAQRQSAERRSTPSATCARRLAGFTIAELITVVAIIGILAAVALPVARFGLRRQKEIELRDRLRKITDAIDRYHELMTMAQRAAGSRDSRQRVTAGASRADAGARIGRLSEGSRRAAQGREDVRRQDDPAASASAT